MAYPSTFRLKLYRDFKAIDAMDYHSVVRFYEQYEADITDLEEAPYFDCTLTYTLALFETGNYGQALVMCDHLLEWVIMHNVATWGGEDIYAKLLFKKAAALYQLQEYPRCEYVLRELIKLHPFERFFERFLCTSLLRQKPRWHQRTRVAAMMLIFLAAGAVAVELFVVRPFFLDYYTRALVVHNVLIGAGVLVLLTGELRHYWRCKKTACDFANQMRARKTRRGNVS